MLSPTRSSSVCISVTGRSLAILVPTSFAWCRTPAIRTRSKRSGVRWQPFATANSIVFEPCNMSGVSRCTPTGGIGRACSPNTVRGRSICAGSSWRPGKRRSSPEQPTSLLRGLIHSDGCRVINRVGKGKYAYPRYLFSNRSEDIRRIFREACDSVGVRPTNPKPDEISIARRVDVVALDSFVGSKT